VVASPAPEILFLGADDAITHQPSPENDTHLQGRVMASPAPKNIFLGGGHNNASFVGAGYLLIRPTSLRIIFY
jgi:hypothetical protein